MNALYNPLTELESFNRLAEAIKKNKTPALATGVLDSQKVHLLWALCKNLGKNALIVANSELDAKELYEDIRYFFRDKVKYFPSKDIIFYNADVKSGEIMKGRLSTLSSLLNGEAHAVVLSLEALFDRLTNKEIFKEHIISLQTGDSLSLDSLALKLIQMGYDRAEEVTGAGQFSIRGGIADIYTPVGETAYRVEFWGDIIDSIRLLDITSQRSVKNLDSMTIFPATELVYNEEMRNKAIQKLNVSYEKYLNELKSKGQEDEAQNLKSGVGEDIRLFSENERVSGLDRYIQFFYDDEATLLDYLPNDTLIFLNEPARLKAHSETVFTEFTQSIENRIFKGYMLPEQMNMVFSYAQIQHWITKFPVVLFSAVTQSVKDFVLKENISFTVKSAGMVKGNLSMLYDDIRYLISSGHRVLFLSGTRGKAVRFAGELNDEGISASFVENLTEFDIKPGSVCISKGAVRRGFSYQFINFTVISDKEVFGGEKKQYTKKAKNATKIESFLDLKIGDYVVHRAHGIGVYRGIEKITVDNVNKDYMKLSYSDQGTLYVPVNSMDAVQKYIGGDSAQPKLNKLGGNEWSKAKQRTKNAVKILAEDLVALYAKRQSQRGYTYSSDTVWQAEFEEGFPFEETEDQLQSIEEVKADMENDKVMDRLLCGDVGYGKTEVAIRAAFKAVQDNKQVAYLVPTTILAQQHYNTFAQRMKDFPIGVELLSRFRTKKQQTESIDRIAKGLSDIVIGTHRLLSKDVSFKDLGLVIVDEEQRFGVGHKEKLKRLRENVDVLTLTATPIPRTLHMSLTGLRDMSVLEEPPLERHPIQTYVLEYNPEFVRDAIHRELARGGQVYYLFNRVRNIQETASRLSELVPEATIGYAHGQMSERALENIMRDFIENKLDVLVCTTIIETGLDISNVNTIIINDADCMGLSQLYQLRGRVGRSNKIAYAYLMYKKDKVLDEVAEKRLQTIREFTEFGSGFKIAMRDLEIRGAGNLLGAEQHGHMDSVGYELYCRLLEEAVMELKGEIKANRFDTVIDIKVNAYIPDFYIPNEETKLEIYKKIAAIENESDLSDMTDELLDRFGDIPKSVLSLLDIAMLKAHAHSIGINQITQKNSAVIVSFDKDAEPPHNLMELINRHKGSIFYTAGPAPYLTYKFEDDKNVSLLKIKEFLAELTAL